MKKWVWFSAPAVGAAAVFAGELYRYTFCRKGSRLLAPFLDKKGHLETQMTGTGEGYFARDGKIIPIKWSRESNSAKYVYTDLEGNPVSFGIGKTYVAITPDGSPFNYK